MGIRKIPKGAGSLTGYFYSVLNKRLIPFESLLERDFFLTLEFASNISSYDSQPLEIVRRVGKTDRKYYPDCLIQHTIASTKPHLLVEVKHSKDLENPKKKDAILERMTISEQYAAEQGWDFKMVTDRDICGARLENFRFLYKYSEPPEALPNCRDKIFDLFQKHSRMSVADIVGTLAGTFLERAMILPCIWHLVRCHHLSTDLLIPLTNQSMLEGSNVEN